MASADDRGELDTIDVSSVNENEMNIRINNYVWKKLHFTGLVLLSSFKVDELLKEVALLRSRSGKLIKIH